MTAHVSYIRLRTPDSRGLWPIVRLESEGEDVIRLSGALVAYSPTEARADELCALLNGEGEVVETVDLTGEIPTPKTVPYNPGTGDEEPVLSERQADQLSAILTLLTIAIEDGKEMMAQLDALTGGEEDDDPRFEWHLSLFAPGEDEPFLSMWEKFGEQISEDQDIDMKTALGWAQGRIHMFLTHALEEWDHGSDFVVERQP